VSQAGKLTWRVDWPARWQVLGVTAEPFGKDHASRGSSYDTGKRIVREVFGGEPPYPVPYEWIALKGQGDMSSSKGNLVSIVNLTQTIPPEVVRYMIFRVKPMRSITFDPGLPLLNLVDEYDDVSAHNRDQRAAELARLEGMPPLGIPFKHLVHLVQITEGDMDKLCPSCGATISLCQRRKRQSRGLCAVLAGAFSPAEIRSAPAKRTPGAGGASDAWPAPGAGILGQRLRPEMDGDTIHALVYTLVEEVGLPRKRL
jgi:lysyl-tRNA synthetase class 1